MFVFDEPTIGLHPLDVQTLLQVFDRLMENGATVIVIEHDLDVIAQCGLCDRYGARRRRGRWMDRGCRNAGGDPKESRKCDGKIPAAVKMIFGEKREF